MRKNKEEIRNRIREYEQDLMEAVRLKQYSIAAKYQILIEALKWVLGENDGFYSIVNN